MSKLFQSNPLGKSTTKRNPEWESMSIAEWEYEEFLFLTLQATWLFQEEVFKTYGYESRYRKSGRKVKVIVKYPKYVKIGSPVRLKAIAIKYKKELTL